MTPAAERVADRIYATVCRKHEKPRVRKERLQAIIRRLMTHMGHEMTRYDFVVIDEMVPAKEKLMSDDRGQFIEDWERRAR